MLARMEVWTLAVPADEAKMAGSASEVGLQMPKSLSLMDNVAWRQCSAEKFRFKTCERPVHSSSSNWSGVGWSMHGAQCSVQHS